MSIETTLKRYLSGVSARYHHHVVFVQFLWSLLANKKPNIHIFHKMVHETKRKFFDDFWRT